MKGYEASSIRFVNIILFRANEIVLKEIFFTSLITFILRLCDIHTNGDSRK